MRKQVKQVVPPIRPIAATNGAVRGDWPVARDGQPDKLADLQLWVASIAHEVTQPLSGILTNANACRRMLGAEPPNLKGAAETVRRTIRDVQRVVDLISRLRALFAMRQPVIERVGLNETVLAALALLRGELDRSGVAVHCNLRNDAPLVRADRILLQQVILNLVKNAIEAMTGTHEQQRIVTISTMQDDDNQVTLSVHDVGAGIAPCDADKLFKPLYSTKADGMGMGLCISRSIVERHGGRLWATPNDGAGTTFWLLIPGECATFGQTCDDMRPCEPGACPTATQPLLDS